MSSDWGRHDFVTFPLDDSRVLREQLLTAQGTPSTAAPPAPIAPYLAGGT